MSKADDDNRSNQLNPNNDAYWPGRGESGRPDDWDDGGDDSGHEYTQDDLDNHANQLNPNNDAYHRSRGDSDE